MSFPVHESSDFWSVAMAIITILSGSYCSGKTVVTQLCQHLSYRCLDEQLLDLTSKNHDIPRNKLAAVLSGSHDLRSKDALRMFACLEVTLAELIQDDDAVLSGCGGFLIPGSIAHVLRVCLIADVKHRVTQAGLLDGLSESQALDMIQTYDSKLTACVTEAVSKPAYDESLYDIVIPLDKTPVDAAVKLICDHARSDAIKTTSWSRTQAQDFLLSTRVKLVLVEAGHRVEVSSENGRVTVGINERVIMMGRLEEKLRRLAAGVEGVSDVTTKPGSKFTAPSINPWDRIETPPKILLVDDEKEFVQTLSERLKTRNLESSIAFDGEQALEMIKNEVPDVIVLDLLMPGIDGIETLRRVKQSYPEVEVIILTGHGSDREQAAAEELGAFGYLRKPVNVNELAQVMKEAYTRRRGERRSK